LLVLQHGALKRLIDTGSIDVWTPQTEPEPGLNIHHVVRRRAQGESITRAKAIHVRMTVLQELTNPEAWAAGYKSRDDFFDWWRSKFMTGPLMEEIECWCATYQREDLDIPQFMTHPIAGRGATTPRTPARASMSSRPSTPASGPPRRNSAGRCRRSRRSSCGG
jgi:hypothetical protein